MISVTGRFYILYLGTILQHNIDIMNFLPAWEELLSFSMPGGQIKCWKFGLVRVGVVGVWGVSTQSDTMVIGTATLFYATTNTVFML